MKGKWMNFHTLSKINNSPEETLLSPKIYYATDVAGYPLLGGKFKKWQIFNQ